MSEEKMTARQVAERVGISLVTFHRWMRRGWGPDYARLPSGYYQFDTATVEEWIENMNIKSGGYRPEAEANK